MTKWVNDGSPVDVVYLDLQKAFDKVSHQRLLLKLKAHGIGNDVINWIEKWLTHRKQRVIVDGKISNWKAVLSGVPQGSVFAGMLMCSKRIIESCCVSRSVACLLSPGSGCHTAARRCAASRATVKHLRLSSQIKMYT